MRVRVWKVGGQVSSVQDAFLENPEYVSLDIIFDHTWTGVKDIVHFYTGESLVKNIKAGKGFGADISDHHSFPSKYIIYFYDVRSPQTIILPDSPDCKGVCVGITDFQLFLDPKMVQNWTAKRKKWLGIIYK